MSAHIFTPGGASVKSVLLNYQLRFLFSNQRFVLAFSNKPFLNIKRNMPCLYRFSLRELLPYWVRGLFQCDSDYSHTSSHVDTFLPEGEARLEIPYPEPSHTASTRTLSSASNSSTIRLPTPPPCVPAPESALQCHIGYQSV